MERAEIYDKLNVIARDIFEDDSLVLSDTTTAASVEKWDSLTHLIFISDIEAEFGITFTLREVSGSKNVGELVDALISHLK